MNVEALAQSVAAALQPNRDWTPEQRRVIASIMLIQECTFAEAAGALYQEMQKEGPNAAWWAPHILSTWVSSAGHRIQHARFAALRRKPVAVVPSHANWGALSNVISCEFNQQENRLIHDGRLQARILGVELVKAELRKLRWRAVCDLVEGRVVGNDNDPERTQTGRWFSKVQAGWVRRLAVKRGVEARHRLLGVVATVAKTEVCTMAGQTKGRKR